MSQLSRTVYLDDQVKSVISSLLGISKKADLSESVTDSDQNLKSILTNFKRRFSGAKPRLS